MSIARWISEMGGNRTETRPLIVKDDAEKADVSIRLESDADSNAACADAAPVTVQSFETVPVGFAI